VPGSTLNARAQFPLTTAIASGWLLFGCAHAPPVEPTSVAPPDPPGTVVLPSNRCCQVSERPLRADEVTPHGEPVSARLDALVLRCGLRYADGTSSEVHVRSKEPREIVFRSAETQDPSCNLCFSELRLLATLSITSTDGRIALSDTVTLRELEPNDGYVFELVHGDIQARGLLQDREPRSSPGSAVNRLKRRKRGAPFVGP
jgi:hypothetical protein